MRRYHQLKHLAKYVTIGSLHACAAFGADAPTYTKEIAPILWNNCAGCHRPGEIGPFSLLTYQDAAKRSSFIQDITATRKMPPWKPEHGFGSFHDQRRLTDKEIATIAAWADAGAPEGDAKDLPPAPKFTEGWQHGPPDLVLKVPEPFPIPASGRDVYRCFVIPIPIDSDKTVALVDFRPGNRRVVHHALMYLDSTGAARRRDAAEDGPGYASFGGPGIIPTGGLGGWAPGAMPRPLPDGVGKFLRKGSDLVLQIHYHPDGKPETDQSLVGVYFTKTPAQKIVGGIAVRSRGLNIPPGERRYHVSAQSDALPVDVQVTGITPHMHYIGKEMKVVAQTPTGQTIPLIWIKDWDFNWQGQYQYQSPVKLAEGSVIKLDAYYDNSSTNPSNPSKPPKRVRWGEQTTDEMCLLGVQVITDNLADLRKVLTMRGNRLGAVLSGGDAPGARAPAPLTPAQRDRLAKVGFPIPERFHELLGRYDTNHDGKLTTAEIDAMPENLRDRVRAAIHERLGDGDD
jgi:mono/diheme cytochrome c family protein